MQIIQKIRKHIVVVGTNFIIILFGVFIATNLSTVLGQTGDWGMLASGIVTAVIETMNKTAYKVKKNWHRINKLFKLKNLSEVSFF